MNNYIYTYDAEKALESVKYITKLLGFMDKYLIGHLLFVAEMAHIEGFGRPIFGDRYAAIAEGAICSGALSIASDEQRGITKNFLVANGGIKSLTDANLEVFSESDIQILGWVCGLQAEKKDWQALCKNSEWATAMEAKNDNGTTPFRLLDFKELVLSLKDGQDIWEHIIS